MSHIVEIYTEAIHENLRPLHANWEPDKPVELGDYGPMEGRYFIHLGNIRDLGVSFTKRVEEASDRLSFASKGSTTVKLNTKGSMPIGGATNTKATLEIHFSSEDAVFLNAAGCSYSMIRDKATLGREIMERYRNDRWDRGYAIVTDMVEAGATTVVVSGGTTSSIVFEASGDVEQINLAEASIGLNVASQTNVGYVVATNHQLVPLIGLSKIQPTFLWFFRPRFNPLLSTTNEYRILAVMENSKYIQTEENPEDLYFGQLK